MVHCGGPPAVDNGYLYNVTGGVTYQSEAFYHCNNGFNLNSVTPASCNKDGLWVDVPVCNRKSNIYMYCLDCFIIQVLYLAVFLPLKFLPVLEFLIKYSQY